MTISKTNWPISHTQDDASDLAVGSDKQGHIADNLCQRIRDREFVPGEQLPLYKDLEQQYGVSRATLQHAMNRLKREGFIRTAGRRGAFVADYPPCLYRYGLVLPTAGYDAPGLWRAMQEVISNRYQSAQGKRIALYRDVQVHVDNESFQQLWTDVKQHRLAGLILVGGHGAIFDMEDWFSPSMPGVGFTLEHLPNQTNRPGRGFLHLDIAGFRARALDYLIARGSRNIAVIAQPYEPHLRPITGEMTQRGLQVRDHWILRTAMEQPQCAHDLARLLFSQDDRPDGLIIMDDNLVESTVAGIVDARVVVPDQLKIVAHCNWPIPSTQLLPCTMLGFEAAEFLDYAIQTIDALRQQRKDLPATLIKPRFADERITNRPG